MRLPVLKLLQKAIELSWQKKARMARALFPTITALVILDIIAVQYTPKIIKTSTATAISAPVLKLILDQAFLLLKAIVFTLLSVTCHRLILLGDNSVPAFGIRSWSMRETRFLGRVVFLYILVSLLTMLTIRLISIFEGFGSAIFFIWLSSQLLAPYLISRLIILLPAAAIGHLQNAKWAWNATRANGWRMVFVVWLIPTSIRLLFYYLPIGDSLPGTIIDSLAFYVSAVIAVIGLSFSFALLAGENTDTDSLESFSLDQPLRFGITETD